MTTAFPALGRKLEPLMVRNLARAERSARESLDDATFNRCVAAGHLLTDAAADRLALGPQDALGTQSKVHGSEQCT